MLSLAASRFANPQALQPNGRMAKAAARPCRLNRVMHVRIGDKGTWRERCCFFSCLSAYGGAKKKEEGWGEGT